MFNKTAYQFQLKDHLRSTVIFFGVFCVLLALSLVMFLTVDTGSGTISTSGWDSAIIIFLLVSGLVSFRESFHILMQNSVSRKSMFLTRILATVSFAAVLAVADRIFFMLAKLMTAANGNITFRSLFELIYAKAFSMPNPFVLQVIMFFFSFLLYLIVFTLGYFISILFYRSGKAVRVAMGVGIPVGLFVLYPIIDFSAFDGKISMAIIRFLDFALGITRGNPYAALISLAVGFIFLSMLSWLVMRKASVKA